MSDINKSFQALRQLPPALSEKQVEAIVLKLHLLPPPKYYWFSNFHINHLIVMSTLSVISLSIWLLMSGPESMHNSNFSPVLSEDTLTEFEEVLEVESSPTLSALPVENNKAAKTFFKLQPLSKAAVTLERSMPLAISPKTNLVFNLEDLTPISNEWVSSNAEGITFHDSLPDKTKIKAPKRKSKIKMQSLKDKRKAYKQRSRKMKQKRRLAMQRRKHVRDKVKSSIHSYDSGLEESRELIAPQVEVRPVASFESLEVSGLAVVYLNNGPTKDITVDVEGMPIEDLITKVENGKLIITTNGQHNGEEIRVSVSSKNLKNIIVKGAGEVICQDAIESNELEITVAQVGAAWLEVNTKKLTINMEGGDLDLSGYTAKHSINWDDPDQRGSLNVHKFKGNSQE